MKDSEKRLITSLGSLVFIASALYVYASWISPEIAVIQKERSRQHVLNETLVNYEAVMQEKIRIIAKYQDLSATEQVFAKVIPQNPNVPSFLNQLYGLADLNNVLISAIEFSELPLQIKQEGSLVKPHGTVQATIRCTSTYEDMKKYLNAIQTNIRIMNITAVNISEGFKDSPLLSYSITVETYYLTK